MRQICRILRSAYRLEHADEPDRDHSAGAKIADVGTGAGFPAIPLLIMNPTLKITLVDSLQKRITFLGEVLKTLGLSAECVHARAEDFGRDPKVRGRFDATVSRAVASLPVLLELTVPLLKFPIHMVLAYP